MYNNESRQKSCVGEALGPPRMIPSHVALTTILLQMCRKSGVAATPVPSSPTQTSRRVNHFVSDTSQTYQQTGCVEDIVYENLLIPTLFREWLPWFQNA